MLKDIVTFFSSRWVVGALLALALMGLIIALSWPQVLPPTIFFAGIWYTRLLWLLVALSLGALLVRGLRTAAIGIAERGLRWAVSRFLTSIPLAIVLITLLVLTGLISTSVPQLTFNRRVDLLTRYGPENYSLLESLGFFTIFSTWYVYAVVALFVLNLLACTVKRLRTSLQYVRLPMRPKHPAALMHLPCFQELMFAAGSPSLIWEAVCKALRARGFRVREEGGQLLAEKWRWERFAIDVFHVSLLVAIGALLITNTLGYDYLQINYKGDVFSVRDRDFQVRVDDFWSENYPGTDRVMDWKTRLTVIEDGQEVKSGITEVNHPFTYQGVSIYQAAMGEDWLGGARVTLRAERGDGTDLGEYSARVSERFAIASEGVVVEVGAFLPDFALVNGVAYSKTQRLLKPAAHLNVYDEQSGERLFQTWTFSQLPQVQLMLGNPYRFYLMGMVAPQFTGLELSWDPGLPVAYAAFTLMITMLVANLYFKHQMVWVVIDEGAGVLWVGGRSRKGDFSMAFQSLIERIQSESAGLGQEREPELISLGSRSGGGA
jgi:cytochrome c biogenesis protein